MGRLASSGNDGALSTRGTDELGAPLPGFIPDGGGVGTGLPSGPIGDTLPVSSRGEDSELATDGFGVATRCPLITARTSLIARVCSRGDLSMLIWSILESPLTSTLASEP
jgi:hypothetical protein